jgi:long-chain acyl-CoA synthetase
VSFTRPYPWERSYPPGVHWDAPIAMGAVPAILDQSAKTYGDKPAIEYRDGQISYRELAALSQRAAEGFRRIGVTRGTPVAVYLPNTPYHLITFFGVLRLGARIVHLSPLDAERELAFKLSDSGARILVTTNFPSMLPRALKLLQDEHVEQLVACDDAIWGTPPIPLEPINENDRVLNFKSLLAHEPSNEFPKLSPDDIAVLQYTGGTTGTPKGAMLSHGNLTAAVSIYSVWQSGQGVLPGQDRIICVLPLFHIYALTSVMLRAIQSGNELMLRPRFDVETTLRDIEEKHATAFPGVPTMWIALNAVPGIEKRDLSSLKHCYSGGAPMPVEVQQRFERLTGHSIRGGWGMTESSPAGTNLPYCGSFPPGTIGLPLPGIVIDVVALDDPTRVLGFGETGEMRIKGPNVFKGYWNRPEETAASFVDGFFLTGDIVYMQDDGYLFLVDRKKDMIISGGFNVYPQVVEQAIYEHPDVEEVMVIGIRDTYRGEAAKAFVKLRAGAPELTLDMLHEFLADKVGKHEMPSALEIRKALPRTSVGKLSKKELVEEERSKHAAGAAPEPLKRTRS